jgi:hypothetical protein
MIDMVLELLAPVVRPAIVDLEEDPAPIDEVLRERPLPAARDLLAGARTAIMLEEDGVFLPPARSAG